MTRFQTFLENVSQNKLVVLFDDIKDVIGTWKRGRVYNVKIANISSTYEELQVNINNFILGLETGKYYGVIPVVITSNNTPVSLSRQILVHNRIDITDFIEHIHQKLEFKNLAYNIESYNSIFLQVVPVELANVDKNNNLNNLEYQLENINKDLQYKLPVNKLVNGELIPNSHIFVNLLPLLSSKFEYLNKTGKLYKCANSPCLLFVYSNKNDNLLQSGHVIKNSKIVHSFEDSYYSDNVNGKWIDKTPIIL